MNFPLAGDSDFSLLRIRGGGLDTDYDGSGSSDAGEDPLDGDYIGEQEEVQPSPRILRSRDRKPPAAAMFHCG